MSDWTTIYQLTLQFKTGYERMNRLIEPLESMTNKNGLLMYRASDVAAAVAADEQSMQTPKGFLIVSQMPKKFGYGRSTFERWRLTDSSFPKAKGYTPTSRNGKPIPYYAESDIKAYLALKVEAEKQADREKKIKAMPLPLRFLAGHFDGETRRQHHEHRISLARSIGAQTRVQYAPSEWSI